MNKAFLFSTLYLDFWKQIMHDYYVYRWVYFQFHSSDNCSQSTDILSHSCATSEHITHQCAMMSFHVVKCSLITLTLSTTSLRWILWSRYAITRLWFKAIFVSYIYVVNLCLVKHPTFYCQQGVTKPFIVYNFSLRWSSYILLWFKNACTLSFRFKYNLFIQDFIL